MSASSVLATAWRHHAVVAGTIVTAAVVTAVATSLQVDERWAGTSSFELRRTASGESTQAQLEQRVAVIGRELDFTPPAPLPRITARPGSPVVELRLEGPMPRQLSFFANVYAAELVAWELGPQQRAIQRRYRRTLRAVDEARPGDPANTALRRELRALERRKVTDSQYRKSRAARRVDGPAPLRDGALALALGALLASAVVLVLERFDRSPSAGRSSSLSREARQ